VVLDEGLISRIWLPLRRSGESVGTMVLQEYPEAVERHDPVADELARFFEPGGPRRDLAPLLKWPEGTRFRLEVLRACAGIPRGAVRSYGELASAAGFPGASRAAGSVMAGNPLPLVVPCHRIVRADGSTGRYGGGEDMKRLLLQLEGVTLTP